MSSLLVRVEEVIGRIAPLVAGTEVAADLAAIERRLREPLRVAIAGKTKAGKSTLLNALVGELVAPTGAAECTKVVTWYVEGQRYRATAERIDGTTIGVPIHRDASGIDIDLTAMAPDEIERIVVEWPSSVLRDTTFIDTPGIGSLSDAGQRTIDLLAADDERGSPADAVIYLTPHLHSGDVRFLQAFTDDATGAATPVNAVGVLSRADEIGGGRLDALQSAGRVAERYRGERDLRRMCQTFVPVAGLLAQGAATLTDGEFRALGRIAALEPGSRDDLLRSAERFAAAEVPGLGLLNEERIALLHRLGIFGVRLSIDLLARGGVASSGALADRLRGSSGLDDLRALLRTHMGGRRDLLKARSALLALSDLVPRVDRDTAEALGNEIERLWATAHELSELRALLAVRRGDTGLPADAVEESERLLGSSAPAAERLRCAAGADAVQAAVVEAIARWRGRAEHPLAQPIVIEVSQVVVRTLEGLAQHG